MIPVMGASRWLVGGTLAAACGVVTFALFRPVAPQPDLAAIRTDANAVAGAISVAADTARVRADVYASEPMLRAGIETDEATLQDMDRSGELFQSRAGEACELYQRGVSVLRDPAGAPHHAPLATGVPARVDTAGSAVAIVASAPVDNQAGALAGQVVVTVAADLAATRTALARDTSGADLVTAYGNVALAPSGPATAAPIEVPLSVRLLPHLVLRATPAPPGPAVRPRAATVVGLACCFFAAGMFGVFGVQIAAAARRSRR